MTQPRAERGAAGEVDDPDGRVLDERLGDRRRRLVGGEHSDVGIEAGLDQDFANDLERDRRRQDRRRMRLDDDAVAGGETGEQAGIEVPRREGRTADFDRNSARHDAETLGETDRLALALRLFPARLARDAGHLGDRIGDRFETPILGVRTARLKGHAPRLPRGVLHGVGNEEALRVQARQRLDENPGARFDGSAAPGLSRGVACRNQGLNGGGRVSNVERLPERRGFRSDQTFVGVPVVQGKGLADQRLEGGVALRLGRLAVDLRRGGFRVGAEIVPRRGRSDGATEQRLVSGEEIRHSVLPWTRGHIGGLLLLTDGSVNI